MWKRCQGAFEKVLKARFTYNYSRNCLVSNCFSKLLLGKEAKRFLYQGMSDSETEGSEPPGLVVRLHRVRPAAEVLS